MNLVNLIRAGVRKTDKADEYSEGDVFPSSAPFISGDSFRALSTHVYENDVVSGTVEAAHPIIFCKPSSTEGFKFLSTIEAFLTSRGIVAPTIVFHNGDSQVSPSVLEALSKIGFRIFSVNAIDDATAKPIPIGLENLRLGKNGKLKYFSARLGERNREIERDNLVLSNFHVDTNFRLRSGVANLMSRSRHGHQSTFLKTGEYFSIVFRSKFVISPPGNGSDCHRTWESIYLGAIPVVLRQHFPESFSGVLPVLAVDKYEDFLDLTDAELHETFYELKKRPIDLALMSHWYRTIAFPDID